MFSRRLAKEKAEEHPLVIQELGLPLTSGPWYNASLELTHAGHIASCKLTFHGRQSSSDILIRVCGPLYVLGSFHQLAWLLCRYVVYRFWVFTTSR